MNPARSRGAKPKIDTGGDARGALNQICVGDGGMYMYNSAASHQLFFLPRDSPLGEVSAST
jgi:hypothetical protein